MSTSQTADAAARGIANEQQLDDEALALVLMAAIAAYSSGGDLPPESIPHFD